MLFKSNNSFSDELAPLGKELVMLKVGNTYEIVTPDTLEILSNGSYIKLDPETNLDYQRRYYNFAPIYPNYSMRNVPGVDKDHVVIQTYVRIKGYYNEMLLCHVEEKIEISEDINLVITLKALLKQFTEKCYLVYNLDNPNLITDPNQESEPERIEAIYH